MSCIIVVQRLFIFAEWQLAPNLWLKNVQGVFGMFMTLVRGTRSISFSPNIWKKLRSKVPLMRTKDFRMVLTDDKDVSVVEFMNVRYVNFHCTYRKEGKVFDTYINLKDEEWAQFSAALDDVDAIFPAENVAACPECFAVKKVVHITQNGGRMHMTSLTPEMLQDVKENNAIAFNQQMYRCEYCGGYSHSLDNSDCHCHIYNCRKCEPDNFCNTCSEVTIFAV